MDITSLYIVALNDERFLSLKYSVDQCTVKELSTDTLLRLTERVLTLHCFSFSGELYTQTNSVAIETKLGPNYANLFVGYEEEQGFNQLNGLTPELFCRVT